MAQWLGYIVNKTRVQLFPIYSVAVLGYRRIRLLQLLDEVHDLVALISMIQNAKYRTKHGAIVTITINAAIYVKVLQFAGQTNDRQACKSGKATGLHLFFLDVQLCYKGHTHRETGTTNHDKGRT